MGAYQYDQHIGALEAQKAQQEAYRGAFIEVAWAHVGFRGVGGRDVADGIGTERVVFDLDRRVWVAFAEGHVQRIYSLAGSRLVSSPCPLLGAPAARVAHRVELWLFVAFSLLKT